MSVETDAVFIEVWLEHLAKLAMGLDFNDPDDRATFRGRVHRATRHLKWDGMRRVAAYLGADTVRRSRDAGVRAISDHYMRHPIAKKAAAQLDAEIAEVLANGEWP